MFKFHLRLSEISLTLTRLQVCPGTGIGIGCTALSDVLTGSSHLLSFRPWTLPGAGFIVPAFCECVRLHRPAGAKHCSAKKLLCVRQAVSSATAPAYSLTRHRAGASLRNYPEVFAGRPCHSMVFVGSVEQPPTPRLPDELQKVNSKRVVINGQRQRMKHM